MSNTTEIKTFGPYSPIRKVGTMYFTAGHVGADKSGTAQPDAARQTAQALENLAATLATIGLTLNDVVKVTLFLTDMADFGAVNEVYLAHFAEPRPARSTVAVRDLPHVAEVPLRVEIEAVAAGPQ